jgi:1,2-diacylglycerol 3-alpha-glucosyltransferase
MKILMVSDVYFPRINGVSTSIKSFRDRLIERGIVVDLIAPDYPGGAYAGEPEVIRVASRVVPQDPEDRLMRLSQAVSAGLACQPDLVHVHTPFVAHVAGMRIARARNVPVLVSYHTLFEEYAGHYLKRLPQPLLRAAARFLSRWQCNEADQVIVPSEPMRERLAAYGVTSAMNILPTGIRAADFASGDRAGFRRRIGATPETVVALFVGRVAHEKNLPFLLAVAHRCRQDGLPILMVIAGEGPALEEMKGRAESLGIADAVRFVGYLARPHELADCYAAADVFTFASKTETQGLVLIEAMAAGLPVLALAEMGTRDLLLGNPGALVAPDDPHGFAQLLAGLARRPAWRTQLGEAARRQAQRWDEAAAAERLLELYRRTLTAGVTRPSRAGLFKAPVRP